MDELYRAVASRANAKVVVDSSKSLGDALALARFSSLDVRVIHLVRDPRGIVQSWSKSKPDPSLPGGYTLEESVVKRTAMWLRMNASLLRHRRALRDPLIVEYEELASDPSAELERIASALGLPAPDITVRDSAVELPTMHTMAGNPMRFDSGTLVIRPDDEWRTALPRWKATVVHIATEPLRRVLRSKSGQRSEYVSS
jgi:hypothetical protein